ncbi:GUN4 domain-containing protein [Scytonema sp. NUACC26]|uniref:GUN4 domain-containing protein n=1 Tax=Scytonema sp. NUACC26 TaxID=3140176 RepID=UPI0034DCB329
MYIIDRLWKEHSQERFGFSPQARIYQEVREDYDNFCTRVGWKVGQRWKGYNELNWTNTAPVGHLRNMQGRKLYPTTEQNRGFHLNSWALDLGDRAFGFMESVGLMEGTLISVLTQKLADCDLI